LLVKFDKELLRDMAYGEVPDGFDVIDTKLLDHGRWSLRYEQIFRFDGKIYVTQFSKGATEMQDERPYDYAPEQIECPEMEEYILPVTQYRLKT
jgi:hypothetical protein